MQFDVLFHKPNKCSIIQLQVVIVLKLRGGQYVFRFSKKNMHLHVCYLLSIVWKIIIIIDHPGDTAIPPIIQAGRTILECHTCQILTCTDITPCQPLSKPLSLTAGWFSRSSHWIYPTSQQYRDTVLLSTDTIPLSSCTIPPPNGPIPFAN